MAIKNKKIFSKISVASLVAIILSNQAGGVAHASTKLNEAFPITYNPGHGGGKPGAIATNGLKEHDICTDISVGFKKALDDFSIKNATTGKSGATNSERIALARELKSLNVEFHNNSGTETSEGFEVYVQDKNDKAYIECWEKVAESFSKKVGTKNRGIKLDKDSQYPEGLIMTYSERISNGALVEMLMISNPNEVKKIDTVEKREMMGYLFGGELLVGFNVITREDADRKIREAAVKYKLLEEDTKEDKKKNESSKNSTKKLSTDELIKQNRKLTRKLEAETKEILERIEALNEASSSNSVASIQSDADDLSDKENLDISPKVLRSINRLNNQAIDTSNETSLSEEKVDTEKFTDTNNSQNDSKDSNNKNADKMESIDSIKNEVSSDTVKNEPNIFTELSDSVINNINNINKESLNNSYKNEDSKDTSENKEGDKESSKSEQSTDTNDNLKTEEQSTNDKTIESEVELNETILKNIENLNKESSDNKNVDIENNPSNITSTIPDLKFVPKEESGDEEAEDESEKE